MGKCSKLQLLSAGEAFLGGRGAEDESSYGGGARDLGERKPNSHLNVYKANAQTEWGGVVGLVQTAEEMKDVATFQIVLWPSQALCEI